MHVNLIGFQNIDFVSDDGSNVKGTNLFISFSDDAVIGLKTGKFFIRPHISLPAFTPPETLDMTFDMKGRVLAVVKVNEADSNLIFGGSFKE